jgi:hypothetical protein
MRILTAQYFAKPENRLKFWRRADSFLAEHLGGRLDRG